LTVLIIAVSPTVAVVIGPDCAGDAADCGTDCCAFEHPEAGDQSAGSGTKGSTTDSASRNAAKRRIIASRLTSIILAILIIAVGISVIIIIGPYSTGETANAGTDCGAFDEADAGDERAGSNARSTAKCSALRDVASRAIGSGASAKRDRASHHGRQKHFSHNNLQPVG
jgi:hypothetical protein